MKKTVLLLLARLAASLAAAGASLYFFAALPYQQSLEQIRISKDQVVAVQRSLDEGVSKFKLLPLPSDISPQQIGVAKDYVSVIDSVVPTFNVAQVDEPKTLHPLWSDDKIKNYNLVIGTKTYYETLGGSIVSLRDALSFLDNHRSTMYALANLLEYNPEAETKDKQPDVVISSLEAAAVGLDKTIARLHDAPKYKDVSVQPLIDKVKSVETARKTYYDLVNAYKPAEDARKQYVAAVVSAQNEILANREAFWNDNYQRILESITNASNALKPQSAKLQNI